MNPKSSLPESISDGKKWLEIAAVLIALILAGFLIYSNSFQTPFQFDDHYTILKNPLIKSLVKIKELWAFDPSRFITHWTFALNYRQGLLNLEGFHLVNLLLHIGNAFLVFIFSGLIWEKIGLRSARPAAKRFFTASAAFVFLCHPLQTQAVTYISQRGTLLATWCYLLTLILFIGYKESGRKRLYFLAMFTAIVGSATKPIIFTLPFAILLYEWLCLKFSWRDIFKKLQEWIPFFLIALSVPVFLALWRYKLVDPYRLMEMTRETEIFTRQEYLFTQFSVIVTYFRLFFLPFGQNLDYDYPISGTIFHAPAIFSFLALTGLLFLAFRLREREPLFSFGVFWIFLTLSVESSFFPIRDVINEHRMYLPMAGFAMFIPWLTEKLFQHPRRKIVFVALLLIVFSGLTYQRNKVWGSVLGLWEDIVRKSPNKVRSRNNLGNVYIDLGRLDEAQAQYQKAIELDPNFAFAYNNLANIYRARGKAKEAIAALEKAVELDPTYYEAYTNLATFTWDKGQGDMEKASEYLKQALNIYPHFAPALVLLGYFHLSQENIAEARFYFNSAIDADPGYSLAYAAMGDWYRKHEQYAQALEFYYQARLRDPQAIHNYVNIGNIFSIFGDDQRALAEYEKALQVNPLEPDVYFNIGNVLSKSGNPQEARRNYLTALELYRAANNHRMIALIGERLAGQE